MNIAKVYVVQFEDDNGLTVVDVFAREADARQRILSIIKDGGYQVDTDHGDLISATDRYGYTVWASYDVMPVR